MTRKKRAFANPIVDRTSELEDLLVFAEERVHNLGEKSAVTVIVATYNRPDVLRFAVQSVLDQTFGDFSLLVIGDNCGPSTEQMLHQFADSRLVYLNLPRNVGEQSGVNSLGMRLSRSKFFSFLNHDDIYLPHHLETSIETMVNEGLDLYLAPWIRPVVSGESPGKIERYSTNVTGNRTKLPPRSVFVGSSQVVRREFVSKVGDWRAAYRLRGASSQDFIFRSWAAGARVGIGRMPSVAVIPSFSYQRSYQGPNSWIHEEATKVFSPNFRFDSPTGTANSQSLATPEWRRRGLSLLSRITKSGVDFELKMFLVSRIVSIIGPLSERFGYSRRELWSFLYGIPKGQKIQRLQKARGLIS